VGLKEKTRQQLSDRQLQISDGNPTKNNFWRLLVLKVSILPFNFSRMGCFSYKFAFMDKNFRPQ